MAENGAPRSRDPSSSRTSCSSTCRCPARPASTCPRHRRSDMPATVFVTAYDQYALKASTRGHGLPREAVRRRALRAGVPRARGASSSKAGPLSRPAARRRCERVPGAAPRRRRGAAPRAPPSPGAPRAISSASPWKRAARCVVPVGRSNTSRRRPVRGAARRRAPHVIREACRRSRSGSIPTKFLRIHRSAIVRLELVESSTAAPAATTRCNSKSGVRLRVSRSREALERWLGWL